MYLSYELQSSSIVGTQRSNHVMSVHLARLIWVLCADPA